MHPFPHHYVVTVEGKPEDNLTTFADNIAPMAVAPPVQFGGQGGEWSPEELLMAAVANCFVLSFRAVAKASNFEWVAIECESNGKLDKVERKLLFTDVVTRAKLTVSSAEAVEKGKALLEKAEATCLVSNSLSCQSHLECDIVVAD